MNTGTGTQTLTLVECEAKIIEGDSMKAEALKYIRDRKLSPKGGFEHYCLERWDLTKQHVNRLIRAYEIKTEQQAHLGPLETTFSESHYREISRLKDAPSRTAAIRQIRERFKDNRSITATQIKEIVDEMSAKVSPSRRTKAKATEPIGSAEEFEEDESATETEPIGSERHSLDDFDAALKANIQHLFEEYAQHFEPSVLIAHIEQVIRRLADAKDEDK